MSWGTWGKNLSTSEMQRQLAQCIDIGIHSFDHADIYGDYSTEAAFGKAFQNSGISRSELQLISKCGIQYTGEARSNRVKHYEYTSEYIVWSVEQSLQHLHTEYLDLLLLHRPSPLMRPEEIAEAVEILRKDGKILDFGVSNFNPAQTALLEKYTAVSTNQIEVSLTNYEAIWDGSLTHMQSSAIRPMAWSPLGSYFKETSAQQERLQKEVLFLAEKYSITESQVLLAWLYKHPAGILPVVGTTTISRLREALEATAIVLSTEDWFALLVASQGHKVP